MSGRDTTNNGWNLVDGDQVTRVYVGADLDGCTFLSGDVAALFAWFFDQVHTRVEPVTMLNGWRSLQSNTDAGGDNGSNHMSGTAGDVNGYRHPYEAHTKPWSSGWSAQQQQTIRQIMAETGGLVSWGLDYRPGYRDAMHFDLTSGTTPAQVAAFVATLTPPPIDPTEEPIMYRLYRIIEDGRIFLGGPGCWSVVPDMATYDVLRATYGDYRDVSVQVGQGLDDSFTGTWTR